MDVGPLRRLVGALGLFALIPTAWLLATGAIDMPTAALRAVATLVAVMALGRLLGVVVGALAVHVEGRTGGVSAGGPGHTGPDGEQGSRTRRARQGRSTRTGAAADDEG